MKGCDLNLWVKKLKIAKKAALLTAAVASAATGRAGRRVAIELAKKTNKV